ncbi:MAG: hypothetical protein H0U64_02320 [Gemmatimonadaceae bacterium]|nr:hypothetical protein [Gemmatimonadaceae bacterium]MBA3645893.1 hypothetical protein [Gemmatimonadaceae bacterium]
MAAAGFSDPVFARISDLAHLIAGLSFPANRQPSAEAGMRRAMSALHISDPVKLLHAAEHPGEARDVVLAELTVGESYFFRDSAQLNLLATEVLPGRSVTHGPNHPLRLWSAGCASGEEPYTLAILLRELGWPHPARILGTDIALPRVNAARRGRYTRWALRGVSEERVERWFQRTGSHYDLDKGIRECVEFRILNLVQDEYPIEGNFDLVLCRNVMIYFDLPTVARIASGLLESLASDGWLVLGASDPPLANLVSCESVMTPFGIAYRRPGIKSAQRAPTVDSDTVPLPKKWDFVATAPPTPRAEAPEWTEAAVPAAVVSAPVPADRVIDIDSSILFAYEIADYVTAESLLAIALAAEGEENKTVWLWILYIRTIANQGRLHEAGEFCARALEVHPLAPELHYLHATLLSQANWHSDAAIAARRSIYLDRKFVMGHLQLGDALTRLGDSNGARISFENVITLLEKVDATDTITAADGVPASRLRQIATLRLRDVEALPR